MLRLGALIVLLFVTTSVEAQRRRGFPRDLLKDGSRLRSAFKDVVRDARNWTVNVRSGGRTQARGVIVSSNGYILTKASQVDGAIACDLPDGRELMARVVHEDTALDLKLLKVNADELSVVKWAAAGDVGVGHWVVTPGQGERPLAVGIVSVPTRTIPRRVGFLGVGIRDAENGARIDEVMEDTAASRAGLETNDLVTHVAGERVHDRAQFVEEIRKNIPGTPLKLSVEREGRRIELTAILGQRGEEPTGNRRNARRLSQRRSGFEAAIQHDSVLLPTECGGVLLDLEGRAVGLNIARSGRTASLALAADVVRKYLAKHLPQRNIEVFSR